MVFPCPRALENKRPWPFCTVLTSLRAAKRDRSNHRSQSDAAWKIPKMVTVYVLVLEQEYIGESVKHRSTQPVTDASKRIGAFGKRFNTTTNRNPKTIAEVRGNADRSA